MNLFPISVESLQQNQRCPRTCRDFRNIYERTRCTNCNRTDSYYSKYIVVKHWKETVIDICNDCSLQRHKHIFNLEEIEVPFKVLDFFEDFKARGLLNCFVSNRHNYNLVYHWVMDKTNSNVYTVIKIKCLRCNSLVYEDEIGTKITKSEQIIHYELTVPLHKDHPLLQ